MPSATTPPRLEDALAAALCRYDGPSPLTAQVQHHFGLAGERGTASGRRVRMRLTLCVAAAEGARVEPLDAACAVELLHNADLVHDDIEDGDDRRGGRPTLWSQFGLAHGINAGDALAAIAYLHVLEAPGGEPAPAPELGVAMVYALQRAHYAACGGRASALAFERAAQVSPSSYLAMLDAKVGSLVGVAAELGALSAGAGAERAQAYARLGRAYRVAVELEADVQLRRRWSYPVVHALAGPASAERSAIAALTALGRPPSEAETANLRAALAQLGALDAARAAAADLVAAADAAAETAGIDRGGTVRAFLRQDVRRPR